MAEKCKILLLLLCPLMSAIGLERLYSYQSHNLFESVPDIRSEKKMMQMALMGADSFLLSRSTLSYDSLNLGDWHGFQKIRIQNSLSPTEISMSLDLSKDGILSLKWNEDGESYEEISISQKGGLIHNVFEDEKHQGSVLAQVENSEVTLSIIFQANSEIVLRMDDKNFKIRTKYTPSNWSFQSGANNLYIDDIFIRYKNGEIWQENFSPRIKWGVAICLFVSLAIASLTLMQFISFGYIAYLNYVLAIVIVFFLASDFYVLRPQKLDAFAQAIRKNASQSLFEEIEELRIQLIYGDEAKNVLKTKFHSTYNIPQIADGFIVCDSNDACSRAENITQEVQNNKKFKVLFLGTSQTIGSGASKIEKSFFAKVHRGINKIKPTQSINASFSGRNAQEIHEKLKQISSKNIRFNLAIINLGFNGEIDTLEQELSAMIEVLGENKTKVILVSEANRDSLSEREYLKVIPSVAKKLKISHIDLFGEMNEVSRATSKNIWWDEVHFNDLGHEIAAEKILKFLIGSKEI